ncbi:MAG: hypothetical protein P8Y18_11740 [Candidatus Bathyarchaeota archaeon]
MKKLIKQSIITILIICSILLLIQAPNTFASKPIKVTFEPSFWGWDHDVVYQKILGRTVLEQWKMTTGEPYLDGDVTGPIVDFTIKYVKLYDQPWDGNPLTPIKFLRSSAEYFVDATIDGQNGLIKLNVESCNKYYEDGAITNGTWRLVGIDGDLEGIHGCGKYSGTMVLGEPLTMPQYTGKILTR